MNTCGEGSPLAVGSLYIGRWTATILESATQSTRSMRSRSLSTQSKAQIQNWILPAADTENVTGPAAPDLSNHPLRLYHINFQDGEPGGKSIFQSDRTMRVRVHNGDVYPNSGLIAARPDCVRFVHLFNLLNPRSVVKEAPVPPEWKDWLWPTEP